ncbi:acyl-CoA thioesterase/BAAT N-terminal domain-containing protein [Clostridium sp. C8-1-8]|uniref:acyl-CoA thioesterase/bile acid-CoA:amino acid N-acyltransferase family protein n=1 Tax=Clostridium sp. C8-1-8 TaxID=2698831 RepID=UPI00137088BF|nr:acyl-CoA thioesterase/BAAT N-terminal domain-containing protein [Clostridium sp. C8-1-8]
MTNNCEISIIPDISRADEPVDVIIKGLAKNTKVTIRLFSKDYYCINTSIFEVADDAVWESYAVFETDEEGKIDLEKSKPIEGTYRNIDKMGLFYSMTVKENHKPIVPSKLSDISENRSYNVTFQVELNGEIIASRVHKRFFCDETIISEDVEDEKFMGRYFTSKDSIPKKTVIVVSGSDGRIEKAQAIAELFAIRGYSALAVCYFGLDGVKENLSCIELEGIENAIEWLKKQSTVDKNKIAIYGRSKGGEMVLQAASMFKDISCVIANTPSCYVYEGMKTNSFPSKHSSWMYKGKELPYIKFKFSTFLNTGIRMLLGKKDAISWMYKKLLEDVINSEAAIPLEKINGPILLASSSKDAIWPSKTHCDTAVELLKNASFKYEVKHITYEHSGHMLTIAYQSIYPSDKYPEDVDSWGKANANCWKETVDFLDKWS